VRAWESLDPGDRMIGTAALFTESLQPASAVVPYTDRWKDDLIAYNTALPFANGSILLAYIDRRDQKGKFVLYDTRMRIIKGPVVFSPKNAHRFSAVRLPGGMSTLQPKSFTRKGHVKQLATTLLPGGLIFEISRNRAGKAKSGSRF